MRKGDLAKLDSFVVKLADAAILPRPLRGGLNNIMVESQLFIDDHEGPSNVVYGISLSFLKKSDSTLELADEKVDYLWPDFFVEDILGVSSFHGNMAYILKTVQNRFETYIEANRQLTPALRCDIDFKKRRLVVPSYMFLLTGSNFVSSNRPVESVGR